MRKMPSSFWKRNCFCRQYTTFFLIFFVFKLSTVLLLLSKVSLITSDAYASEVRRSPRVVFAADKYHLPEKTCGRLLIPAKFSRHSLWAAAPNKYISTLFHSFPFQNWVPNIKFGTAYSPIANINAIIFSDNSISCIYPCPVRRFYVAVTMIQPDNDSCIVIFIHNKCPFCSNLIIAFSVFSVYTVYKWLKALIFLCSAVNSPFTKM